MTSFTNSKLRTAIAAVSVAAAALLSVPAAAEAKTITRADLEKMGYICERAGIAGWKCLKAGDRWLCPNDPNGDCIDIPNIISPTL